MDIGTATDMIEDLMVQLAIVRSELHVAQSEADRFKAHVIHAWFCKEHVCETCHEYFNEAKESYGLDHE